MDIISRAKEVIDIEIEALQAMKESLEESITHVIKLIREAKGKVIIIGMGKSGHVGHKIAATLSSMGTSCFFVHPAEACHGDLGMVQANDVVIMISNSGETDEILNLLPSLRRIGVKLISITSSHDSTLAKNVDYSVKIKVPREACYMNIAPTSSTTAVLVYGDALAVCLAESNEFTKDNFGLFHPKGNIGKKLLTRVSDLMSSGEKNPIVKEEDTLHEVLAVMSNKAFGLVNVIDETCRLKGIITAGDLIRYIEKNSYEKEKKAKDIMNQNPITVKADLLAVTALEQIHNSYKKLVVLPVVDDDGICLGTLGVNDLLNLNFS